MRGQGGAGGRYLGRGQAHRPTAHSVHNTCASWPCVLACGKHVNVKLTCSRAAWLRSLSSAGAWGLGRLCSVITCSCGFGIPWTCCVPNIPHAPHTIHHLFVAAPSCPIPSLPTCRLAGVRQLLLPHSFPNSSPANTPFAMCHVSRAACHVYVPQLLRAPTRAPRTVHTSC